MRRSRFHVAAMDCPSEEQLIRTALAAVDGVARLEVDIGGRSVTVWHDGDVAPITARLVGLELGAELRDSQPDAGAPRTPLADQSRALKLVLAINAVMFAVELVAGWLAESTGLLADSLDMLADAAVYGISLYAVGAHASAQRTAARLSGSLQLVLALGVFAEVARRAWTGSAPEPPAMAAVAGLALAANVACMIVLARHRRAGVHLQASWIFTSTDVIANAGVIAAGALVAWTSSAIPDLVIGALIGLLVLRSALRILALARG